jgi:DNA-directed RNA polymerase specialized sigma24 family protein
MVLANAAAIRDGVRQITLKAKLGKDITADLIGDATLALLDKRGAAFDPSKGNASKFCQMVAYQVARDAVRSMNRGGQFSGAYTGFGNAQIDAYTADGQAMKRTPARSMHTERSGACDQPDDRGMSVKVGGLAYELVAGVTEARPVDTLADWTIDAREAIRGVLSSLTADEQALWAAMQSGTYDAATYAAEHGIATATAHVRTNRLRKKLRGLLKDAA